MLYYNEQEYIFVVFSVPGTIIAILQAGHCILYSSSTVMSCLTHHIHVLGAQVGGLTDRDELSDEWDEVRDSGVGGLICWRPPGE